MIIFENTGEIDPRLVMLIGVNVKETESPIGFFGTGLKYAVACLARWGESLTIQSGTAEFTFAVEEQEIRGKSFGVINMCSRFDRAQLGFTTDLGKTWEPWMIYRELWCNAHDEPGPSVYEAARLPAPRAGLTRVIVSGDKIEAAHRDRWSFLLNPARGPLHVVGGLEIYEGASNRLFYRGISVQDLGKPSLYTYNVTEQLWLSEDRTTGSWQTDPIIARGLARLEDRRVLDATLLPPADAYESKLDYGDLYLKPSDAWLARAAEVSASRPLDTPASVRRRFEAPAAVVCPTCGRAM